MGNDGGSIPDRRDLVRNKPKAEQADKANQTKAKWFNCALSKRPLQEPVVSCALGKLYNKDALLEYLLDRAAYGDGEEICGHIRSLKDVKTLKLTPNTSPRKEDSVQASTQRAEFVCPLSFKEMNGVQPFVYLNTCGCVFSQAGLKAVSSSTPPGGSTPPLDASESKEDKEQLDLCPQCGTKYSRKLNVVTLNPSLEEESDMRMAMELQRQAEPAKKSKKRKSTAVSTEEEPPKKKAGPTPGMNPKIAAVSREVVTSLAMEEAKRKATMSDAVKSLYGTGEKRKDTFMTMNTFTRYA